MCSVEGPCPACKRPLVDHLPSRRYPPEEVLPGKVAVVNGRCWPDGRRGQQKLCWVHLREPMTVEQYRQRFAAKQIRLEPCPCCAARLVPWGSCPRRLMEGDARALKDLRLVRGRCSNPDCPVCTVTHYPYLLTPYHVETTADREAAVRAHVEDALSWSKVGRQWPWVSTASVQRWQRQISARAAEVVIGIWGVWHRLDPQAATGPERSGCAVPSLLRTMFRVCDAVRNRLGEHEGWTDWAVVPALSIPRLFRPPMPTTLPVWT